LMGPVGAICEEPPVAVRKMGQIDLALPSHQRKI
jgi:hypothetical protein